MQTSDSISADPGKSSNLSLEEAIHSASPDVLKQAVADPGLTEDLALALLQRGDVSPETIEQLTRNSALANSRKVKLAVVSHPHTPRYVSVGLVRHLFTFDLMQVALTPTVPADVKVAADEALINRMETISSGERLSLARRASGRVASKLLFDPETRVMETALDNSQLTEVLVVRALNHAHAPAEFVSAVCGHPKWSVRRDVKVALLRNPKTLLHVAIEMARGLPPAVVHDVLRSSQLSGAVKAQLLEHLGRT